MRAFKSFEDWLALAVNAFLRDDAAYMDIMRKYGPRTAPMGDGRLLVGNQRPAQNDHPADYFARALGEWMRAMQAEPTDYLGRVYEEVKARPLFLVAEEVGIEKGRAPEDGSGRS